MVPIEKVKSIVTTYESLEKELASGSLDNKVFVKKSKEYSSIGEVIKEAKGYISFEKEKKELEKIINEKNGDSLVFYQTGGGEYPTTKLFPFFLVKYK